MALLLQSCGGGSDTDNGTISPPDAVVSLRLQLNKQVVEVKEVELRYADGSTSLIPQSQFTQKYVSSLPSGAINYKVVADALKVNGLQTTKEQIPAQYANELTDFIIKNQLNEQGLAKLLKQISFPDANKDGVVGAQDVTSLWPNEYVLPETFKGYVTALLNGQDTTQQLKEIFKNANLVSVIETPNAATGELTLTLSTSAANNTLKYRIVSDVPAMSQTAVSAINSSQVDKATVTLQPGENLIYNEVSALL